MSDLFQVELRAILDVGRNDQLAGNDVGLGLFNKLQNVFRDMGAGRSQVNAFVAQIILMDTSFEAAVLDCPVAKA